MIVKEVRKRLEVGRMKGSGGRRKRNRKKGDF